jgi:hypothetical protein
MRRSYYAYIFVPATLTALWTASYLPWKVRQPPPTPISYEGRPAIWIPPHAQPTLEEIAHRKRMDELRNELDRILSMDRDVVIYPPIPFVAAPPEAAKTTVKKRDPSVPLEESR